MLHKSYRIMLTPPPDFDHPSGSVLGIVSTIQVIGGIAALPFAPMLADRLGRRVGILIGSLIIIAGAGIQGGGSSMGTFLGGRGLVGFGSSFIAVAAAPMIGELAYPSHRPIITAIYNTSWASILTLHNFKGSY